MTYDMRDAISKIDNIPLVKESIPELTKLANGFDPSIPGYLALGRLHQITNLAKSAKTAEPPQGTIKDKTTQAAGLMALMGGRGQMAAQNSAAQTMRQPGPVPQNTPEPEMQAEVNPEEMMGMGMADGGITSMDIDPRMFNFDGGGIVTFANDVKEKKQQVKEKEEEKTSTLGNMFREILASISLPASEVGDSVYRAGQALGTSPGLLEELTPSQRAAKERAAEEIRNPTPSPPKISPEEMAKRNEQNRLRSSFEAQYRQGNTASSPYAGTPLISPEMQKATNMQPPAPPKPPMGGINDGKMPVPGANIPTIGTGAPQAMPENKFLTATEKFIGQQPEVFNEAAETAKIKARNEAAGIGTYANVMREQQKNMRDQFERSRPTLNEDIVGMLRRYARPGAMAGDVGDEANTQMRTDRAARMQFAQDQFKVTEAIERLEEARRTGNVDKIAAAEAALKKANIDLRNHQMTAAASAASVVSADQRSAADRAQQLQIENAKLQAKKAELAIMNKDSDIAKIMKEVEALEKAGKPAEALKKLELWGKANALKMGAKYDAKDNAPTPDQISKAITARLRAMNGMDILDLKSKDPAKRAKAEANIKATKDAVLKEYQVGGGGGGGGGAKPTLEEFMAKAKPANPNTPDAELKAYYQKNYGG
jgi:hypothetical protein